ncbi:MAG: DUF1080 domain-containing protein [Planctomycetota bacterium]
MNAVWTLVLWAALWPVEDPTPFEIAVRDARAALEKEDLGEAHRLIFRALERDPKSIEVWSLRARWAEMAEDRDDLVYALHQQLRLSVAQKASRSEQKAIREKLETLDPIAPDLLDLSQTFIDKLEPIAKAYEKDGRPHSAIRVHQEILSLDPENVDSRRAIERMSAKPDPSLAETATPVDLFADVSEEWIEKHDAKYSTWETRAKLERDNYVTFTDAGYEVLVRSAEAMEQMNAFYRVFFEYGTPEHGGSVPRINLNIFKDRDEYLKLGIGPPVEWSGGHFTGGAVETYIPAGGGFTGMVGTLFHEAAHQFVSLSTSAVGWLNEGLASFFEGCRILPNGTVLMNLPANHRLFPLASRMENGWMTSPDDGIDSSDPNVTPTKAPSFRIVLENAYAWGPPWYAPTWGVVYFLYNFQDPVDGRFIYRDAFRIYIDKSGGRSGEGAIKIFEETVLWNPAKRTPGVDFEEAEDAIRLPRTVDELNEVWKKWILELRDEQSGSLQVSRPYLKWANHAITRGQLNDAAEHFEKGVVAQPTNIEILLAFAEFLADRRKNPDRATKLVRQALRVLEFQDPVDEDAIRDTERLLSKWDPKHRSIQRIHEQLWATARNIAQRYLAEGLPLMTMESAWRLGTELNVPDMFQYYEQAVRDSGKSIWIWKLAYNERNLDGWAVGNESFQPNGPILECTFGSAEEKEAAYQFLTLDQPTAGDYSLEAQIRVEEGQSQFCGLVFGQKSDQTFHALIMFPGQKGEERYGKLERKGSADMTTFYGAGDFNIWRHSPVDSSPGEWHTVRLDVTGTEVDFWFDGAHIVTQDFGSRDVLSGNFGLLTGPGNAQYRDVRYIAYPPNDPGARIERDIRMEKLGITTGSSAANEAETEAKIGPVNNSFVGFKLPWLEDAKWIQKPRKSWEEVGPVPQLFLLWSIAQNESIPVNGWLMAMADRYEYISLEVVSIAGPDDAPKMEKYLQEHPFPGSIAVDTRRRKGYGENFERFLVPTFNLPRVMLLDIDHRVIWEGDPGMEFGRIWKEGDSSYLDTPMQNLINKYRLGELGEWRAKWTTEGIDALRRGDFETAWPLIDRSIDFDERFDPLVGDVQLMRDVLRSTANSVPVLAAKLEAKERTPAMESFIAWAELMNLMPDRNALREIRGTLRSGDSKIWGRAVNAIEETLEDLEPGNERDELESLSKKLEKLDGHFPQELKSRLDAKLAAGDIAGAIEVAKTGQWLPGAWLARHLFSLDE